MFYLRCSIGIERNHRKIQVQERRKKISNGKETKQDEKKCVVACDLSHSNYEVISFSFISARKQLNVQSLKNITTFYCRMNAKCSCSALNMVIEADAQIRIDDEASCERTQIRNSRTIFVVYCFWLMPPCHDKIFHIQQQQFNWKSKIPVSNMDAPWGEMRSSCPVNERAR